MLDLGQMVCYGLFPNRRIRHDISGSSNHHHPSMLQVIVCIFLSWCCRGCHIEERGSRCWKLIQLKDEFTIKNFSDRTKNSFSHRNSEQHGYVSKYLSSIQVENFHRWGRNQNHRSALRYQLQPKRVLVHWCGYIRRIWHRQRQYDPQSCERWKVDLLDPNRRLSWFFLGEHFFQHVQRHALQDWIRWLWVDSIESGYFQPRNQCRKQQIDQSVLHDWRHQDS